MTGHAPVSISEHLRSHPIFNLLSAPSLALLSAQVKTVRLAAGEVLFAEGDPGEALYTILDGALGVYLSDADGSGERQVARLEAGETVGEIALLTGAARSAGVRADTDAVLIRVPRSVFDEVVRQDPQTLAIVAEKIRARLHRNRLDRVLTDLFGTLPSEALEAFAANAEWRHLQRGEALWRTGDRSEGFHVLVTGRLQVLLRDAGGDVRIAGEVVAGEAVGEMGMLTGEARSADVMALRDSALVGFSTAFFNEISSRHPDILRGITRLVIRRLRSAQEGGAPTRAAAQYGIIPLSGGLDDFGRRLADAIRELGDSVLYVDGSRFDELLGIPGAAQLPLDDPNGVRLRAWFDEQEGRYEVIVYQADGEPSNWGRRVARQADLILLAANPADDPELKPIETILDRESEAHGAVKRALVLVHPGGVPQPTNTARWLATRELDRHYHLASGGPSGIERLVRHLTQRAVGVVLSGGGARGFAHIGVLRALDEAGVPIDFLSGVSAGALVAALYGIGLPYEEIQKEFLNLTRNAADFTLPVISMISGRKMARRIRAMFGEVRIEDLPIPVFCVSSNLSNATVFVHSRGRLWEAVLASNTPVGFVPPVVLDGQLLMDGNALNNLPADVMAGILNGGPLIGVDVSTAHDLDPHPAPVTEGLSGWRVLWSRINPWRDPILLPSALNLIMRSQELSSLAQSKQYRDAYIDFYLEPPVSGFPVLAYENAPKLVQIGYEYASGKLNEWGEALPRLHGPPLRP